MSTGQMFVMLQDSCTTIPDTKTQKHKKQLSHMLTSQLHKLWTRIRWKHKKKGKKPFHYLCVFFYFEKHKWDSHLSLTFAVYIF